MKAVAVVSEIGKGFSAFILLSGGAAEKELDVDVVDAARPAFLAASAAKVERTEVMICWE